HFTRSINLANDCSEYVTRPDKSLIDRCASWLGLNQPGITTRDPTPGYRPGQRAARTQSRKLRTPPNPADLGTMPAAPQGPLGPTGGVGGSPPKLPSPPPLPT